MMKSILAIMAGVVWVLASAAAYAASLSTWPAHLRSTCTPVMKFYEPYNITHEAGYDTVKFIIPELDNLDPSQPPFISASYTSRLKKAPFDDRIHFEATTLGTIPSLKHFPISSNGVVEFKLDTKSRDIDDMVLTVITCGPSTPTPVVMGGGIESAPPSKPEESSASKPVEAPSSGGGIISAPAEESPKISGEPVSGGKPAIPAE